MSEHLRALGFFFGAVIPGGEAGDRLLLQSLGSVDIAREDITTVSDCGSQLLEAILAEWRASEP